METADCTILKIDHNDTHAFSQLVLDYLNHNPFLKNFYDYELSWNGLEKAIEERKKYTINRQVLVKVLKKQYENRDTFHKVDAHIDLLAEENTFTICSAHQPNLLTGHLYFFYKIIHSIFLSEKLKEKYPHYNFVPVFYIGSEDNDLDELNHFYFRNKRFQWNTTQTGAVGRMRGIDLDELKKELFMHIGRHSEVNTELIRLIEECYNPQHTIAEGTARFLHELLADYGLVIINTDEPLLKNEISHIIKDELLNLSSHDIVRSTSAQLSQQYNSQAFVRELNLFYLKENMRERIIHHDGAYQINNTDISFTQDEILTELQSHPERFSPNVILRGVYQESILPNIAFIGGGSEVAYWFQLRELFRHHQVFYPAVLLRQSIQIVNRNTYKNIQKNNLSWSQVFQDKAEVLKNIILRYQGDLDLSDEHEKLEALMQSVASKAERIDKNLVYTAGVIQKGVEDLWARLHKKLYKAEKKKWSVLQQQLEDIDRHIFPNNTLQERQENILEYYIDNGPVVFKTIYQAMNPFGEKFSVIILPS